MSKSVTTPQRHTSGPWTLHGSFIVWAPDSHAVIAAASDLRATTAVQYSQVSLSSPDFKEAAANARLIAAAPELLAALKGVLVVASANAEDLRAGEHCVECDAARAAIAKAEGR